MHVFWGTVFLVLSILLPLALILIGVLLRKEKYGIHFLVIGIIQLLFFIFAVSSMPSFFQTYVQVVGSLFSDITSGAVIIVFIIAIIPSMISTALSYKPKDFLGYCSKALIWCASGLLVIISPISLFLFLIYRKMFKFLLFHWPRFKVFISPILKKIMHIIGEIISTIFYPFIIFGIMVFLPFYIPAVSLEKWIKRKISEQEQKHNNDLQRNDQTYTAPPQAQVTEKNIEVKERVIPASHVCYTIWSQTDLYPKCTGRALSRTEYMHLWGVFFYIVVKAVKDQSFVNEVYSYFDRYAIEHIQDPEHRYSVVHTMRQEYREIRMLLNEFKADIFTEEGKKELWEFTKNHVLHNKNITEQDHKQFIASYHILKHTAISQYSKSNSSTAIVRYSLSEPCKDPELPNE